MPARRRAGCTLYLTIAFTRGIWAFTTRTKGRILQEIPYMIVHQCRVMDDAMEDPYVASHPRLRTANHVECAHCSTLQHAATRCTTLHATRSNTLA